MRGGGRWLLIEDKDRAPQEMVAIFTPHVQEGILTIHVLGGRSGLLLGSNYFSHREGAGGVREGGAGQNNDNHQLEAGGDKDYDQDNVHQAGGTS